MSRFCDGDVNFDTKFPALIETLANKRKYLLHWKWLHDQLLFWEQQFIESELFEADEVQTLLPALVPYLCQIFRQHKGGSYQNCINCIEKDIQWRYELFPDLGWKCLLVKQGGEEEELISECWCCEEGGEECREWSEVEVECSKISIISLGMTYAEGYKVFVIKMHYLLDLLLPNNFQYAAFKIAFGPTVQFNCKEYTSPHLFYLPRMYHTPDNKKPDKSPKKQKAEHFKGAVTTMSFTKLRPVKTLPVSPIANLPAPKADPIALHMSILPLKMANEVNDDFWKSIEAEVVEVQVPKKGNPKEKIQEKDEGAVKPETTPPKENSKHKKKK